MTDLPTTPPRRVQRRRIKGWTTPLDAQGRKAIYVGRGTPYGNPWAVTLDRTRGWRVHPADDSSVLSGRIVGWWESRDRAHEVAVDKFREFAESTVGYAARVRRDLAGRDLMCWCRLPEPGQPDHCHVPVLIAMASTESGDPR